MAGEVRFFDNAIEISSGQGVQSRYKGLKQGPVIFQGLHRLTKILGVASPFGGLPGRARRCADHRGLVHGRCCYGRGVQGRIAFLA